MQLKLLQGSYPNLTCSLPDFLVKLSQLQASGKDLMTPEGLCFLTLYGFSKTGNPDIFFSKTLRAFFLTTMETLLKSSLKVLPSLGITLLNGRCLILNTLDYHKTENGSLLSDILEKFGVGKIFPLKTGNANPFPTCNERGQGISTAVSTKMDRTESTYIVEAGTLRTYRDSKGFMAIKDKISPCISARAREDGAGQTIIAMPVLTPEKLKKRQNGRPI